VSVGAFLGIFALMFVLELPDKTMIAIIVMSTRARSLLIFFGAASAFLVQMGIAVGAGGLLTLLPVHLKDVIVAVQMEEEKGARDGARELAGTRFKEIATAFTIVFVAEFGDLTQIQAVNFTIKTHQPLEVYLAGSAALVLVAFLGAYGGQFLQRVVPIKWIRRGGGVIFAALGVYTLVRL